MKNVIVTGSSGLLGRAICAKLLAMNYNVIGMDITDENAVCETYVCDLIDEVESEQTFDVIRKDNGEVYGLVNNAYPRTADWGKKEFHNEDLDSIKQNMDGQLVSYLHLNQLAIRCMLDNNTKGSIVNISSIYGVVGNNFNLYEGMAGIPPSIYPAIKGGLINFTRYAASRYGSCGIRLNCVAPGGIFDHQDKKFVERYENFVPLKRMGTPEDIAPVVAFLLSEEAAYITGQNIVVDGGYTCI
jgi:NAD(P)-dependent dehydrogenase (short-subunit alcohol dehydrogenase family)